MKNKKILRLVSCLLAICSFGALTGCELINDFAEKFAPSSSSSESSSSSSSSDGEEPEDGDNPGENPGGNQGDGDGENGGNNSSESGDGNGDGNENGGGNNGGEGGGENPVDPDPDPTPNPPDPEKTLLRTEIDAIGHEVAYYSDGTYEDLGRKTPLNFASPLPETQYGYQSLKNEYNGTGLCNFYEDLYDAATAFHNSTTSVQVETNERGTFAELTSIDYGKYGLSGEQAIAVWKVFTDENPIFYWMSNSIGGSGDKLYAYVDVEYADYAVRAESNAAIKAMANECDTYLSGLTTVTERALTIYDYIISKIDYAYDENGYVVGERWAYNIAGGATKGYGVCECYAETYDYFCGLFGIECLNVVGDAGSATDTDNWGGHAWNYIQLDGKWYAVDATWADQPDNESYGGDLLLREYFGIERAEYHATHVVDPATADWKNEREDDDNFKWGVEYQCPMPTLSGELCPVRLTEEGGETKIVGSLEEAFALMTNEEGRYEITLYPHTTVTENSTELIIYPFEAKIFTATTLPKVAHITLNGSNPSYYMKLVSTNPLTLQSNLTLAGIVCDTSSWNTNGYRITQS